MSIFANETEYSGAMIGDGVELEGDSGEAAYGKPVPFYRRQAGIDALKAMGCTDRDKMLSVVERMSEKIARDEPHAAMEVAYEIVDVTGVYRLLATLCCAERPAA